MTDRERMLSALDTIIQHATHIRQLVAENQVDASFYSPDEGNLADLSNWAEELETISNIWGGAS